jgi:hypothetical protein
LNTLLLNTLLTVVIITILYGISWLNGEMSNFDYLMCLNTFSGRSFADWGQYPVFPWILRDYHSAMLDILSPNVYRDLSKPMGALTEVALLLLLVPAY